MVVINWRYLLPSFCYVRRYQSVLPEGGGGEREQKVNVLNIYTTFKTGASAFSSTCLSRPLSRGPVIHKTIFQPPIKGCLRVRRPLFLMVTQNRCRQICTSSEFWCETIHQLQKLIRKPDGTNNLLVCALLSVFFTNSVNCCRQLYPHAKKEQRVTVAL